MEWSGVERSGVGSGVEWSGVEWSGPFIHLQEGKHGLYSQYSGQHEELEASS